MDWINLLIWWAHFVLGLIGWCTGWQTFPEQFGIGNKDVLSSSSGNNSGSGDSACQDVRGFLNQQSSTGTFEGEILFPSDGHRYGKAREQYASVTYAQELSPSIIALVKTESDVQAAVRFASRCGYSVSIRSGGHSYLGTSSCDSSKGACLQVDVTGLNQQTLLPGQVKLGPGNRLKDAAEFLKQNGRFLPTGECPGVALGGHMQTGGFGLFTRHFGPFADRVDSFRIVLADGELHEIVTPTNTDTNGNNEQTSTSTLNDDIFYAVLGGASGTWGVVTELTANTVSDEDYFSVYWKLAYWWDNPEDTEGIVNMMRKWTELATEKKDDWRWGAHWSVVGAKNVPTFGNRIQLEGSWVAPIEQKDDYDFDFFQAIDDACTNCKRFRYINVTEPLSQIWRHRYIRTLINQNTGREFPVPFTRAMQQMQSFPTPDGMEGITRAIAKLLPTRFSPHFVINQLTTIRGARPNRALPWPEDRLGLTLDYFYIPPTDLIIDHEQRALDFGKEVRANIDEQDHRMYWAAYDNPVIEKDWPQYFESEDKYRRLQHIKRQYDPQNLFQNQMSIPLPTAEEKAALSSWQHTTSNHHSNEHDDVSPNLTSENASSSSTVNTNSSKSSEECSLQSQSEREAGCLVTEEAVVS